MRRFIARHILSVAIVACLLAITAAVLLYSSVFGYVCADPALLACTQLLCGFIVAGTFIPILYYMGFNTN